MRKPSVKIVGSKGESWPSCAFLCATLVAASAFPGTAQTIVQAEAECSQAGLIFGMNPLVRMFLLRDRTGHIVRINFTRETVFTKISTESSSSPTQVAPDQVLPGDLGCVHLEQGSQTANRVAVVPRAEIAARQRTFLSTWQEGSAFGTIRQIDLKEGCIVLAPIEDETNVEPVKVSLAGQVQYRTLPSTATQVSDATKSQPDDLQLGDRIYVHGKPSKGGQIDASVVVKGEFRSIIGVITSISGTGPSVKVLEFESDAVVMVKVPARQIYRTAPSLKTPAELVTPSGLPLVNVGLSDLQSGDTVLAIARTDDHSSALGLILITGFGTFGAAPEDPSGSLTWLLR